MIRDLFEYIVLSLLAVILLLVGFISIVLVYGFVILIILSPSILIYYILTHLF